MDSIKDALDQVLAGRPLDEIFGRRSKSQGLSDDPEAVHKALSAKGFTSTGTRNLKSHDLYSGGEATTYHHRDGRKVEVIRSGAEGRFTHASVHVGGNVSTAKSHNDIHAILDNPHRY